jgi:hypothetical protein
MQKCAEQEFIRELNSVNFTNEDQSLYIMYHLKQTIVKTKVPHSSAQNGCQLLMMKKMWFEMTRRPFS